MKRKQDADQEMLAKLSENVRKLIAATERLASAAEYSRRQIDRLSQLVSRIEEVLRRNTSPGISIEGGKNDFDQNSREQQPCDPQPEYGRPLNLPAEEGPVEEYFTDFGFGHFVEFSSYEELRKFQKLPPISGDDIELCDMDEMIRKLLAGGETD